MFDTKQRSSLLPSVPVWFFLRFRDRKGFTGADMILAHNNQAANTSTQSNSQSSKSTAGSVTIGPAPGGSVNLGQTRISSTYQSASE